MLRSSVDIVDTGGTILKSDARPIVLWKPPATMIRLWPLPLSRSADDDLGETLPDQRLIVDGGMRWSYCAEPCDREEVEAILAEPTRHLDYSVVPEDERAHIIDSGEEYSYVNRYYRLIYAEER
jgi:hypothetical protein